MNIIHIEFIQEDCMKNRGFTLAEVLITLGIIGIVAAMTLPTVINKYKKVQTVSQLKKAYSTMLQSVEMSKVEYGDIQNWDWELNEMEFFEKYLGKNFKISKKCVHTSGCWNPNGSFRLSGQLYENPNLISVTNLILADGTNVSLSKQDNSHIHITVDLNGFNKPNTYGKDIFPFTMSKGVLIERYHNIPKSGLYFWGHGVSNDVMTEDSMGCASNHSGLLCGEKIFNDGWEIKSDYPW